MNIRELNERMATEVIQYFNYKKWQRRVTKARKKFPPGTFLNCCGTKAAVVIGFDNYASVEYWDMEHGRFGSCSLLHCGPERMTLEEVEKIVGSEAEDNDA